MISTIGTIDTMGTVGTVDTFGTVGTLPPGKLKYRLSLQPYRYNVRDGALLTPEQ